MTDVKNGRTTFWRNIDFIFKQKKTATNRKVFFNLELLESSELNSL